MPEMSEEDKIELMISRIVSPKLSSMETTMQNLVTTMNQVMTKLAEDRAKSMEEKATIECDVQNIKKILNGNGEDGLVTKVSKISDWVADQKKLQWMVIGALVANFISLIGLIVLTFLKIQ